MSNDFSSVAASFAKRNQHILGARLLSLIEKYPDGPPLSALLELQRDKLGTGDVTNFHTVQPATKKVPGRSSKKLSSKPKITPANNNNTNITKKAASTAKTTPVMMPNVPKSSSLTSNRSTCSKSRPTSAQKSRSSNNKQAPRKTTSGKSPIVATPQKPKPSASSGHDQRRPNTATGDFAEPKQTNMPAAKPLTRVQRLKRVKTLPPQSKGYDPSKSPIDSKTQVVLAPRFGPESSEPSVLNVQVGQRCSTAPPGTVWRKDSPASSVNSVFSEEKSKWVQKAVYKIGESIWSASGLVPPKIIDSPVILDNFGELYDLAVKSKSQGLSSSDQEDAQRKRSSDTRTLSDEHSDPSRSSVGTQLSFSLLASSSKGSPRHVPQSEQQATDLDLILSKFKDKLLKENITSRMKDAATDTQQPDPSNLDKPQNESKLDEKVECTQVLEEDDMPKLIHNCYISEGNIIHQDEPYKFTLSTFAPLSTSLRRVKPSLNNTYFRRTVDLRGFEVHELRFKYSSSRIFVEGKQPQRGDKNARLVREIIALPPELTIKNLKVMRGKKGVVVFEEIIKT